MTVRLIPLGGLGEVGLNALVVEEGGRRVLVDCGVMFPNDRVPGVDVAIPDFSYLRQAGGLDAVLLTHGHEDHVGALPSLLREFPVPVYGTKFTLALVHERLREFSLDVPLHEVTPRTPFECGPFLAEPLRVAHSIPDGVGFALETGEGVVIHTGDFKIDLTPVDGERLDLARFAEFGKAGVAALLSDSTNAERDGFSVSEGRVAETFHRKVSEARGRVIVALFASNVHRIQSLLHIAAATNRRVVLAGRSLEKNVRIARETGRIVIPPLVLADQETGARLTPREVLYIVSGAQGEPGSALARLAEGELRPLEVEPGDTVFFSARSIPGNEIAVSILANKLARRGATVVDRALDPIHASGHAQADEQKILLDAVHPRHFVPIHGEYRMLMAHARTALSMGLAASEVFVVEDGDVLELASGAMRHGSPVTAGKIWLDGRGGQQVAEEFLKDRTLMSELGVVVVAAVIDSRTGEIISGPKLSARGLPRFQEGSDLHGAAMAGVRESLLEVRGEGRVTAGAIEEALVRGVRRAFRRETGKRPAVLPLVLSLDPSARES
jgi:ribonuclease J